ncbi:MAG: glycoside hydrolase [Flavobacteriaceae bacterium]|nr:glycoside hydrolase [Flavobacteriaceae bacterium]
MKKPILLIVLYIVNIGLSGCDPKKSIKNEVPNLTQLVDPMIGTGFHGHTFPGPTLPHGQIQLSPDTHIMGWDASSGYHYDDETLYGFSHNHLSGTGIGDLGDFLFLPFTMTVESKPVGKLIHEKERAETGYYSIMLEPWNILCELTTTERVGWHRYTYPEAANAKLMIDLSHVLQPNWGHALIESEIEFIDDYTVRGYRKTSGWAREDPGWFTARFDQPILKKQIVENGKVSVKQKSKGRNLIVYLEFGSLSSPLNVQVGISYTSAKGSTVNLSTLNSKESFEEVVVKAKKVWNTQLNKIRIESKEEKVLKNFYTAMYHSHMAPFIFGDANGEYRGMDGIIREGSTSQRYSAYSLWDIFRAWFPMMTLINPQKVREWVYDLLSISDEGGLLPKWFLNGNYTGTMVGYPATAVIADAMKKGLLDSIPEKLLKASVKCSKWQEDFNLKNKGTRAENVMPKHIKYKETLGFVPMDKFKESVSYGLEMAYYDWCISQMAYHLGSKELAKAYEAKGKAYAYYFDKETSFMRGKMSDGSWDPNFDPNFSDHLESAFVEGNSWQWTPFVLHDPKGLAELMGGKKAFGDWLDELFTTSSKVTGENASGDITGLIGQYAHGNEPSHHIPYLYQFTDRPWRTQEVLDFILNSFYEPTPEGIIGNEDCGQMSAWYVMNAIGIYQMTPGDNTFYIGRPIVDLATLSLDKGSFTIKILNNSKENKYVQKVLVDERVQESMSIQFEDIKAGSELVIVMGNEPL